MTSSDRDWDVLSAPGTSSNNSSMECSGKPLDAVFFVFGIITTVGTVIEGAAGQASRRWKGRDGWPTGPAVESEISTSAIRSGDHHWTLSSRGCPWWGFSRPSIVVRCTAAFGSNPDIEPKSPNDRSWTHNRLRPD